MPSDDRLAALTPGSIAAIAAVRERANRDREGDLERIERVLASDSVVAGARALSERVLERARVTLNFHPDRLVADGRSVAEALRDDGIYRSQYETSISSGGLSARPGGSRDEWERRLFDGAYHDHPAALTERPKYGGLNLSGFVNGPAPAFGSCALVLGRHEAKRTTFLFGDSSEHHTDMGTSDAFAPVLAALLERVAATGHMLGLEGVSVAGLIERVTSDTAPAAFCRVLDDYIETHTHGVISLASDADALLLDPSYRDTTTGLALIEAAERHDLEVSWHPGSRHSLRSFPVDGPRGTEERRWHRFLTSGQARRLAERVISGYSPDALHLTAAAMGTAAGAFQRHADQWEEWGAPDPSLTAFKDLWRILAATGTPIEG